VCGDGDENRGGVWEGFDAEPEGSHLLVRLSVEQSGLVIRLRGVKNDQTEAHESAS
jgi:hypothetical protein